MDSNPPTAADWANASAAEAHDLIEDLQLRIMHLMEKVSHLESDVADLQHEFYHLTAKEK